MCDHLTYAVGYDLKIESYRVGGDDSALNGIKLICKSLDGKLSNTKTSSTGPWGTWMGETICPGTDGPFFLTSFSLKVQAPVVWDNTAANFIKFKCRDFHGKQTAFELSQEPGKGDFGTYGH
ncbi:vitelline membrane outer layer protein 1 homolog [Mercenaria mercenaria]|uniref:vitelline membrane outer layer protein 1 homolog n=1 Tax=Mercenaria mercenaria TaxID=6596 RepID=UPI00234EB944|nr:vitelline membrane outer layer protein 1 homolog [Mercenaria mercenaria]